MRSPFLASLFLLLSATFGFVAQAADSAADLAVQLGIIANQSSSQTLNSSKNSTIMLNGVVYAVEVIKDKDGNLTIKPIEAATAGNIVVIEKGKQVDKPKGAFPASISFTTKSTEGGGISVTAMTVIKVDGSKTIISQNASGGYTAVGASLAGIVAVDGAATTIQEVVEGKTIVKSKIKGTAYTPTPIVIIYAGTNVVTPGDAKHNPSPN